VTWLAWRQQRTETILVGALLAVIALLLVLTGRHMAAAYHQLGLSHCAAHPGPSTCNSAADTFEKRFSRLGTLLGWFNLLPALLGILFAAPIVQELEHGTYRLSWTQSVTRRRWIATRLGVALSATLLAMVVVTLLTTWWRGPFDQLDGRLNPNDAFDFEGIVPFAYALFALALVLAIGTFTRRLMAAVAGGFVGFLIVRIPIQFWARHSFVAPVHFVSGPTGQVPPNLARAWVLENNYLGHASSQGKGGAAHCFAYRSHELVSHCMARFGFVNEITYQPASRFWELQGIEAAIFATAGLVLLAVTSWWIRRRVG
jgi:hypothetical protein